MREDIEAKLRAWSLALDQEIGESVSSILRTQLSIMMRDIGRRYGYPKVVCQMTLPMRGSTTKGRKEPC